MTYDVRRVRPDEWREVKAFRLQMLQDVIAHIAFLDTYDAAVERPDEFWQERAERSAAGEQSVNYLAVAEDSTLVGSVSGLLELPGTDDFESQPITIRQVHVVGVYVAPAHRGAGLFERLLAEVDAWARTREADQLPGGAHR